MIIFGMIHLLAWIPCCAVVRSVRSRALGLSLGLLGMLVCSGGVMVLVSLSATDRRGLRMADMLSLWALPIGLVGLTLVRTRNPMPPNQCECGYDLSENESGICPECGRPVNPVSSGS